MSGFPTTQKGNGKGGGQAETIQYTGERLKGPTKGILLAMAVLQLITSLVFIIIAATDETHWLNQALTSWFSHGVMAMFAILFFAIPLVLIHHIEVMQKEK